MYKKKGPSYLRLDKSNASYDKSENFILGKALKVREGEDVTLIAAGGVLQEALKAAESLEGSSITSRVLSMHTIKPIDEDAIIEAVKKTKGIITIEENNILGGLGGAVSEVCMERNLRPLFFKRLGMRDEYSSVVGDQDFLRNHYGLDHVSIATHVRKLLSDI